MLGQDWKDGGEAKRKRSSTDNTIYGSRGLGEYLKFSMASS